jgi:CheY-like chemotaxis protein
MKGRVIPFTSLPRSRRPPAPPAAEAHAAEAPRIRSARYAAGRPGRDDSGWQGPPIDGVRIMVVEHDEASREALVTTLQQWGAAVSSFSGANDATIGLDAVTPDAVILAIRIPGDPYRFIAAVRRQDGVRRRHTPMLAIVDDALDRRRAGSAGIHLYVARPLDAARLRLTLANLVRAAA